MGSPSTAAPAGPTRPGRPSPPQPVKDPPTWRRARRTSTSAGQDGPEPRRGPLWAQELLYAAPRRHLSGRKALPPLPRASPPRDLCCRLRPEVAAQRGAEALAPPTPDTPGEWGELLLINAAPEIDRQSTASDGRPEPRGVKARADAEPTRSGPSLTQPTSCTIHRHRVAVAAWAGNTVRVPSHLRQPCRPQRRRPDDGIKTLTRSVIRPGSPHRASTRIRHTHP
jgi:hypothetical protein